ncbi:MAG: carboxylesterase family protein [Gammaproteobacteria bacterium]|nr:carboxylesterase family protein [Gammaproteobacteria bacterium]
MLRLCFCLVVVVLGACRQDPSVAVDGERLTGKFVADGKVAAFLGVPFAEPPLDDLRWRAPQPLTTKHEQRDATEFAAACMQTMRILDWYRYMAETFGASADYYEDLETSEDCLYLNLWTPTLDTDANLPVMVWIHGGSNKSGWSYENNYRGHGLAPQGVVVVTVAYRQGLFGFLSHPDLPADEPVANFGLWDLVAALHWIQDNIRQFGGDPKRVTLFGESSGGENILALMFAKPAQGLFHRAILQSAANYGLSMPTLNAEQQRGSELAAALGITGDGTLRQLRDVPAQALLDTYEANFGAHYHSPAIDGQLLTESTWEAIQARKFVGHDLLIGTNSHEWHDYIANDATVDDVVLAAANHPRIGADKALELVAAEPDPKRAMDRLITADAYVCPSQNTAANRSASAGEAWMYYFARVREDEGGRAVGAFHGAEYAYVFGVHDSYMTTNETDLELTAMIQKYWVNFAASGNPNGAGLPTWPSFERPNALVLELGDEVRPIPAIEPEMCAAFEEWNEGRP